MPSIWDEEIDQLSVCSNSWSRWSAPSNKWDIYEHYLSQKDDLFEDDDFNANMDMIFSIEAPPGKGEQNHYRNQVVGWKRPHEIYPGEEVKLMGKWGHMKPTGIKQGSLADCWFLAGVAAVAENSERLD